MATHSAQTAATGIHTTVAREYTSAAARLTATLVAADVGKVARDLDTGRLWLLTAAPGTWHELTSRAPTTFEINAQTGTAYTLALTDAGKLVTLNNIGAVTLTVPPTSAVALPVGTVVAVAQLGAGQVGAVAGAGVTLRNPGLTNKARAQFSRLSLEKIGADEWLLSGDLATS